MGFQRARLLAFGVLLLSLGSCQGQSADPMLTTDTTADVRAVGGAAAGRAGTAAGTPAGGSVGTTGGDAGSHVGGSPDAGGTSGSSTGGNAVGGSVNGGSTSAGSVNGGSGGKGPGGAGGEASSVSGCIVPLYSYPNAPSWSAIVQAKQAHPSVDVIAIVNPSSGPGDGVDVAFTSGIAKLVAAGIVPIGYVSTSYTQRGQDAVNADTDTWRSAYPAVQGIFFDEQSNQTGDEAFYSAVSAHAKSLGFTLTVGNPGTGVPNSYLGSVDVMLAYESAGTPTLASLQRYAAHRDSFGIIPYETAFDAAFVRAAAQSVRYVYLTDDDLPNPWDSLPSYFDDLLGALAN